MLHSIFRRASSVFLLAACGMMLAANSSHAASDEDAKLEVIAERARAILNDTSFYDKWNVPGKITTPQDADKALDEGDDAMKRVEDAVDDMRGYCMKKFFVNSCIDEARRLSFKRQREIRTITSVAKEVKRQDRAKKLAEERAKEIEEPKVAPVKVAPKEVKKDRPEPIRIAPKTVKEQRAPMEIAPKEPKAPSEPMNLPAKSVKEPSKPMALDSTGAERRTVERQVEAEERAKLEEANEAFYDEKQEKAAERMRKAEENAAKRRKAREERQQRFEKSLEERTAAQKRYEERQQNKDSSSGLSKYF